MKSLKVLLTTLVAMALLAIPATRSSAAPLQPSLVEEGGLSGNGPHKLPSVAVSNGVVNVAWAVTPSAVLAYRPEDSGSFVVNTLGDIGRNSTYFNASVATGADGVVHTAWIQDGSSIHYRRGFGPQGLSGDQTIATGTDFANNLAIGVQGSSTIFVAWRNNSAGIEFVVSTNGGANWSERRAVPLKVTSYAGIPSIGAGPTGNAFMTWTGNDGNIYVGEWNGSNFPNGSITGSSKNDYFNSTVAVGPDGQPTVAWRSIGRGVFYAPRQNGAWATSNVFSQQGVAGTVAVAIDAVGNTHLAWASAQSGTSEVYYSAKLPNEAFSTPIVVSRDGKGFKVNVDLAVSVNNGVATGHVAWESFVGGEFIRYARVKTQVGGSVPATPTPVPPTPTPSPTPAPNAPPTGNYGFASDAFRTLWTRTDSLVAGNKVTYSWLWGPNPFTDSVYEPYAQSPNGGRQVQYFDKSRMEINQPNAPRDQWYVTNGRLADELITGVMQVGDAQYVQRSPAQVAVVGDPTNTFPYYSDLKTVYRQPRSSDHANQIISRAGDGSVRVDPLPSANNDPSTLITQRVNNLGIPAVFWSFMNQSGNVVENGKVVNAKPLFDWRYVIGEPLTEAYWTVVKVGGKDQGVLVQAFERRVLTFTPANNDPYKVEMGNIGRHYFEWRYGVRPR